jgi:HD superfamily phosphohydrolase
LWKEKYSKSSGLPKWVFDLVSNKTTTIDVDKFDYLKRDPAGLKTMHEFSWEILFRETRIVKGEICYNTKTHDLIYDIFHCRYKLFKQIYLHPVTVGIELMLADALVLAD